MAVLGLLALVAAAPRLCAQQPVPSWGQELLDTEPAPRSVPPSQRVRLPAPLTPYSAKTSDTDSLGNPLPDTLSLPFFDNFSSYRPGEANHPDSAKWFDAQTVFLVRSSAINPPDLGTVEFDGTNDQAQRYTSVVSTGEADSLVSHVFDLSGFSAQDNIHLSFWVQSGGQGDNPEEGDDFGVWFRDSSGSWVQRALVPPLDSALFRPLVVPVNSAEFLHSGFQFKFSNVGALTGHYDIWHLDYVRLAANSGLGDTVLPDVAVSQFGRSILDTPWTQMTLREYNARVDSGERVMGGMRIRTRNLGGVQANRSLNVRTTLPFPWSQNQAITGSLDTTLQISLPPLGLDTAAANPFSQQFFTENVRLETALSLNTAAADPTTSNDTLRFLTRLDTLLAYDDGEAESGYGMFAPRGFLQRYTLNAPDTLRAVWINFTPSHQIQPEKAFELIVYADIEQDSLIYSSFVGMNVRYGDHPNHFERYDLDTLLPVGREFYVGIRQPDAVPINVGYDLSLNGNPWVYRDSVGIWTNSQLRGVLMIRPELYSGVRTQLVVLDRPEVQQQPPPVALYPNPAAQPTLTLAVEEPAQLLAFQMLDVLGRELPLPDTFAIRPGQQQHQLRLPAELEPGVYVLRLQVRRLGHTHQIVKKWLYLGGK